MMKSTPKPLVGPDHFHNEIEFKMRSPFPGVWHIWFSPYDDTIYEIYLDKERAWKFWDLLEGTATIWFDSLIKVGFTLW